ncbi:hypothetical protein P7C73_g2464, partial [Tremellales sp. Uapishka_1]
MDALRPGHAHRSSSDRLLNNYLDSQKNLITSLLTLLSHSHSSTSSLLAYVTSSPGVSLPIRRSVRHAAFEGPLSAALAEGGGSQVSADTGTPGWAAYISSLEQFRKDLKQIHLLEEELSRVKRDREILVTRLIKSTKARPTKTDLTSMASAYSAQDMSSRGSTYSLGSDGGSVSGKESKRASKLAEAQSELLGCEEHLRSLEVRIEAERNRVMSRGLGERFRAMETVGKMWVAQARRGLEDLEKVHDLPANAFELDSNGSIAPSQSASQVGYDDVSSPTRAGHVFGRNVNGRVPGGSIAGSIAEEDEDGSSADEGQPKNLVMHENRTGGSPKKAPNGHSSVHAHKPSPLGVPSINSRVRPLSSTAGSLRSPQGDGSDSDSPMNRRAGGRRAASDVGGMAYHPPTGRTPLRRTFSNEGPGTAARRPSSVASSGGGGGEKKKGFLAKLSKFFKGPKSKREGSIRSGRGSPPYGASSSSGKWHTRTDSNLKRSGIKRGGGGADSSSDEEQGNLVSVSNNRNSTWSASNVGRASSTNSKRFSTASGPVASGLIPAPRATRSELGAGSRSVSRAGSVSTVTAKNSVAVREASGTKTPTGGLNRSNTAKSNMSTGTVGKKTRKNGSIASATQKNPSTGSVTQNRTIMSLVDAPPPAMPDVPKAPASQVTPKLEMAKAPGSVFPSASNKSIQTPASQPRVSANGRSSPTPADSISRAGSIKSFKTSTTALPPSKSLQPPLKSAMRPSSPSPSSRPQSPLAPPLELPSMYMVAAPGPVQLPVEEKKPVVIPPPTNKRNSFHSTTGDEASIYESAMEDSSSEEEEEGVKGYKVVENDSIAQRGLNVGPPEKVSQPIRAYPSAATSPGRPVEDDAFSITSGSTALGKHSATQTRRKSIAKSVRMDVPESPTDVKQAAPQSHSHEMGAALPSPPSEKPQQSWSTRIGRMREDTSDESDHDDEYLAARKGLKKNTGKWETGSEGQAAVKKSGTVKKTAKKASSIKG